MIVLTTASGAEYHIDTTFEQIGLLAVTRIAAEESSLPAWPSGETLVFEGMTKAPFSAGGVRFFGGSDIGGIVTTAVVHAKEVV